MIETVPVSDPVIAAANPACVVPTRTCIVEERELEIGGVVRLFEILNMAMRVIYVVADDAAEAVEIAKKTGDLRRRAPRRIRDVTDSCLEEDPTGTLCALLEGEVKGVAKRSPEGWSLP